MTIRIRKNGILDNDDNAATLKFPDGTVYKGQIKDNQLKGVGKYLYPSGSTFSFNQLRRSNFKWKKTW